MDKYLKPARGRKNVKKYQGIRNSHEESYKKTGGTENQETIKTTHARTF